jgi:hypothetical protein
MSVEEKLVELGKKARKAQTQLIQEMNELILKCPHREAYNYRTTVNNTKYWAWMCSHPESTDNFGWGCDPGNCPLFRAPMDISHQWQNEFEQKPTPAEIFEKGKASC